MEYKQNRTLNGTPSGALCFYYFIKVREIENRSFLLPTKLTQLIFQILLCEAQ